MSYGGRRAGAVFVDEVSKFDRRVLDALATKGDLHAKLLGPTVNPLDICCRSCGAPAGQQCSSELKGKTHTHRKPHYRRKHDAQLAEQAARAMLNPR